MITVYTEIDLNEITKNIKIMRSDWRPESMLTYSFEAKQKEPLYEQLYQFIRQDILTGQLRPGEKLPSKRSLAQHLGISTLTVEGAYGQLTAEGYCYTQPKRGFFVSSLEGIGEKKAPVLVHKAV